MYTHIIFEVFIHLWLLFCTFHQRVDNFIGSQFNSLISWDIRKPFRDGTKHLHVVNVVAIINSLFTYKFEPVTAAATAATAVSLSCCCWDTNGEVSTPLRGEASRHAGPRVLQEISKSGPNIVQEFRFHYFAFPHNSVHVCVWVRTHQHTLKDILTHSHTQRHSQRDGRECKLVQRASRSVIVSNFLKLKSSEIATETRDLRSALRLGEGRRERWRESKKESKRGEQEERQVRTKCEDPMRDFIWKNRETGSESLSTRMKTVEIICYCQWKEDCDL